MPLLSLLGLVLGLLTLPATLELLLLTLASVRRLPPVVRHPAAVLHLAVIIPAHNEAQSIQRCIASLQHCAPGLGGAELIVVADNCSDDTASLAQALGVRVLIRNDPERRGKGYALDFAFQQLVREAFDGFLVIDADSRVDADLLVVCKQALANGVQALQCRYADDHPPQGPRQRLVRLAWWAFNVVRPRGRQALGLSVGLLGNGFALRREVLLAQPYQASSIVEDLEYHLQLVRAGYRVQYIDEVCVWSALPQQSQNLDAQRSRWEGGRVRMIRHYVPLLTRLVLSGQWRLLEPLAELLLLPLAWHVSLLLLGLSLPIARPLAVLGLTTVAVHLAVTLWLGRATWDDIKALLQAPLYLLWKLSLMARIWRSSADNSAWQRSEREKP